MAPHIVPETLWQLKLVGTPVLSPDGALVVWVQEEVILDANKNQSRLWIGATDGSWKRPLTAPGHKDRQPVFSPIDTRVAFISDRTGEDRIWLIDAAGGEAEVINTKVRPLGAPAWSPDGTRLAFAAGMEEVPSDRLPYDGAPEPPTDETEIKREERPVVVLDRFYKLDGMGLLGSRSSQICVVEAKPTGEADAELALLTRGRAMHTAPAWSPDGTRIACTISRDFSTPMRDARLYIIDVQSRAATLALAGDRMIGPPVWSPDGTRLAFPGLEEPVWGVSNYELYVLNVDQDLPVPADRARSLTAGLDRLVGAAPGSETRHAGGDRTLPICWHGDQIYCNVMSEGGSYVAAIDPDRDREPAAILRRDQTCYAEFSVAGDRIACVAARPDSPDEIYVWWGDKEIRISEANSLPVDWRVPIRHRFTGPDGLEIEGWLLHPGTERPPLVLSVHGGPAAMYGYGFMFGFQLLCAYGYAVLYVNPRGSQGYGAEFALANRRDWGGKDYGDLMAAVDSIVEQGLVDGDRMAVTGWSYGGFMTNWVVGQTDRFRAAVAGACLSNLASMYGTSDISPGSFDYYFDARPWDEGDAILRRHSPLAYADRVTTPVLFLHGEDDARCPVGQSEEMFVALRSRGVSTAFVRYPGEHHGLKRPHNRVDRYRRTLSWFNHHLG